MKSFLTLLVYFAFIAVAVFFADKWISPQSAKTTNGALLLSSPAQAILPVDLKWNFEFRKPVTPDERLNVALEIRRTSEEIQFDSIPSGTSPKPVTRDEAEQVVISRAIHFSESKTGYATLQIIDMRDFTDEESIASPLRFDGGVQVGGTKSRLGRSKDFIPGHLIGHSAVSRVEWKNGEAVLLQIQTYHGVRRYTYDVVLIMQEPLKPKAFK